MINFNHNEATWLFFLREAISSGVIIPGWFCGGDDLLIGVSLQLKPGVLIADARLALFQAA